MTDGKRKIVILTEGETEPLSAKTATSTIRYRPDEVVALLDSTARGKSSRELLRMDVDVPILGSLEEVSSADTLLIGIAPSGGRIPAAWRHTILAAIARGMDIISGLHEFLSEDQEFALAARNHNVRLFDVRKNNERDVSHRQGIRAQCLRIHTVGQDCCVGKMVVAIELTRELQRQGRDAKFVATGQTGIIVEGDGCPIDCVVADFVNGAAEKLVLANQHHDFIIVEGQGSLAHPRYSAVTLGLLHGVAPQGMILCYEAGRAHFGGMPEIPLQPLGRLKDVYETMASLIEPSQVIGIAMNSHHLSAEDAERERERTARELALPVCDVFRHGTQPLVDAILDLRAKVLP